jgi:hypothetical protein
LSAIVAISRKIKKRRAPAAKNLMTRKMKHVYSAQNSKIYWFVVGLPCAIAFTGSIIFLLTAPGYLFRG